MKRQMTRSGSGIELGVRRVVWSQRTVRRVKSVDEQLVQAQVHRDRETIVGGGFDPMGVRTSLSIFVNAGASVLNKSRRFVQASIGLNREYRYASSSVVGNKRELAGLVECYVARVGAPRCDL